MIVSTCGTGQSRRMGGAGAREHWLLAAARWRVANRCTILAAEIVQRLAARYLYLTKQESS